MNKQKSEIQQTKMVLPHFDHEVSVLYVDEKTPYIPVIELCQMLGLRANIHIPRWRRLVLWCHARKLPYDTPNRGRRMVWCLHGGALPLWFCCFNWSLVLPERRAQLQQATDEGVAAIGQAHQKMMVRYKSMRQHLFEFLTVYSEVETTLPRLSAAVQSSLHDDEVSRAWEELISQGRTLISEATAHARRMLQDQATIPVVDEVKINPQGEVIEELALPLFPVVREEDIACFFGHLEKLSPWYQQVQGFLEAYGII